MLTECRSRVFYPAFLSLLLAALLSLSGCTNPDKAKAEHVARGESYLKQSKFHEASIEFRNALQIDDRLAAAHWGLSQAYEGLQRLPESFEELKRAVELDQTNLEAVVKLGNFYVAGSRGNAELIAEGDRLAKIVLQKDPNNIEGHILLGSVLFAQGQRDQAFQELNHAVDLDPKRVESYLSLARYYVVTEDKVKAEEIFRRAIAVNPNSALAHSEYGKFFVQQGKQAEAEAELRKAVEVEPGDRNSRFVLASFYLINKQFDKAEESYKILAELDKEKPEGPAVLADFYALANKPDEAIKIYQSILAKSPDYSLGRYRLTEIMLASGDFQGASVQIDDALKRDKNDRQALLLRARLRSQGPSNDYKAAIEDLKEVLRQEPNSRAGLYFMSQVNYNMGVMDQARSYAAELEKNYPDYLPAKLLQVQINVTSGDPKSALRDATALLDRLSKTAADRENTPQMLADIRARTLVARGIAQGQLRNYTEARADLLAAREITPNQPDVYNNLAGLSLAEDKAPDAIAAYENALNVDSTNFAALGGLINVYARLKQTDKAHARIDKAIAANPNNASLHFLKAQIYGVEQNVQGAQTELNKALELDSNYINAYYSLAALFINSKQEDKAIEAYQKVLQRKPDNAGIYTLIGMLEDSRKNYDASAQNYRKALEIDPTSTIAANNLAWLYAQYEKGNLDEAVRLAQTAVQKSPNIAGFVDTLGWVYFKKGLYAAAAEQLQKAVDLDGAAAKTAGSAPSPNYPYHLGVVLKAKGDREGARRQLEAALRLGEKMPFGDAEEARKTLATL
jgi:tetratricopeptide (TPR) repeat protein